MKVLAGVRVVELAAFISGPYASMLLGDFGADVIKVEQPGTGDPFRAFGGGLYSPQYQSFNRNKRSIALDLKNDDDRRVFDELVASADILIQNFRPAFADRQGFGSERMRAINPRLIYCSVSGFGESGPYAERPAYDTVAQAMSGFLSLMLDSDQPRVSGPAIADAITGLYAAYGLAGALRQRDRTGVAPTVEVSMLEAMAAFSNDAFVSYFAGGHSMGPYDRAAASGSHVYRCADGKLIALHLSSPEKFWAGLLRALEAPQLADDTRFATRGARIENYGALIDALRPIFAGRSRAAWVQVLETNDVPFAPVYAVADVLEDPQFRHLGLEVSVDHPIHGAFRSIRPPVRFNARADHTIVAPPVLNEHGEAIRSELRSPVPSKGEA